MGILDFAKKVGAKIFGASEAQAAPAEELKKEVAKHGFDTSGLNIAVEGDKVKVSGNATSTADAEKIILAIGNTMGVAQVEHELIVNQLAQSANFYTVVKGDTLWKIAESQYGKGKGPKYTVIFEANKPMLKDPDEIYPGQVLRIPPLA
jgi:nucleoid-associated protein YgaU